MGYLFTSESVSEGHPDKVADQISDAVLDHFLAFDEDSKVACETLVTTGLVVVAGEVNSKAYIDLQEVARKVIGKIGYTKAEYKFEAESCGLLSAIHEQSADINQGVVREKLVDLSHHLLKTLAAIRHEGHQMTYLRPDSKSQVTIEYGDDGKPKRIDSIVISTQHDPFLDNDSEMLEQIKKDVKTILIPRVINETKEEYIKALFNDDIKYYVNPTGKFVIGGPHGDTGLTGRKIIVDTYGGKGAHGGGAFSGKDPSKVDRSAAYAARHIAKNMVAAGVADEMLVQLSYAIGVAEPVSIYVNTYGHSNVAMTDGEIARKIKEMFDLRPYAIERDLKLRCPIYTETAAYGHMGREPQVVEKHFYSPYQSGGKKDMTVELFTWEKLDEVDRIKKEFRL